MYIDEYVIKKGCRIFIGGREIPSSNIDIECNQEQKEALLKNKTIKKKKGESDERESKSAETKG